MRAPAFQHNNGDSSTLGRAVGLVAVVLMGLLVWLSADPEAHERLHHDADHADHHCAITDFALGEAFYLPPTIPVRPVVATMDPVTIEAAESPRESVHYALLPSCGPPFAGLNA